QVVDVPDRQRMWIWFRAEQLCPGRLQVFDLVVALDADKWGDRPLQDLAHAVLLRLPEVDDVDHRAQEGERGRFVLSYPLAVGADGDVVDDPPRGQIHAPQPALFGLPIERNVDAAGHVLSAGDTLHRVHAGPEPS